jgi:phosphoserine phosphatase
LALALILTVMAPLNWLLATLGLATTFAEEKATDPLPSWNEGPAKKAILDFVAKVTRDGGPNFVPIPQRIATFDNDGTLWPENPVPFEVAFIFDRVKADAPKHPEWKEKEPFKAVLENNLPGLMAQGMKGLLELLYATHAGMTTEQFDRTASDWIATAKHPRFGRLYTGLAYQPMRELLAYLRANGFKTFIVSGGGAEFMRVFVEKMYGIPPEQVVGTMLKTKFELRDGTPMLTILPEVVFIDDKAGKPVGIHQLIGRRPLAAFGNSDGDLQMLQWTTIGRNPSFGLIVHHTDAEREYAYDKTPRSSGKLVKALEEAPRQRWTVVDMKKDWKKVFAFEK